MPLTERERRFIEAYMGKAAGNGTQAARLAGYKGTAPVLATQAMRVLRKADVRAAITERAQHDPLVADRAARQQFWTRTMEDIEQQMPNRLKASELLGRSQADFVDRHDITLKTSLVDLLAPEARF